MEATTSHPTTDHRHHTRRLTVLTAAAGIIAMLAAAFVVRTVSSDDATPTREAAADADGFEPPPDAGSDADDSPSDELPTDGPRGPTDETGAGSEGSRHDEDPDPATHGAGTSAPGAGEVPDVPTEDELDETDDSVGLPDSGSDGSSGGGLPPDDGDGPTELEPVGDDEPDPCDAITHPDAKLLVTEDPTVLEPGDMTGELSVRNCSDSSIDWTADTKPSVALTPEFGTVAAGETTQLGFEIDGDQWDAGAIDFKIKVSEPGANTYVDIAAYKPLVGVDLQPEGIGFTAPEGSGGCALQCITSALLTPNVNSPNVSIEVTTNVAADVDVWVSTSAPVDPDGEPHFPGVPAIASSPSAGTTWSGSLAPLQASTSYHIVVAATDASDNTAYRVGTFTTVTPLEVPGGFDSGGPEPGCTVQCITTAIVSPGGDYSSIDLDVATHTPAIIDVHVSTSAPGEVNGDPDVSQMTSAGSSGALVENWSTSIDGLAGDTTYHVVVRATDVNGGVAFQAGTFHTADEPTHDVLITFHRISVSHDGDSGPGNRGELSFAWEVGDDVVGTRSEQKIDTGDVIWIGDGNDEWVVHDVAGFLPIVSIAGFERDPDGIVEFCAIGAGVPTDFGFRDCSDSHWNVASSGLYTVDSLAGFLDCGDLGVFDGYEDETCVQISTVHQGDDYASFTVVVSYEVL